MARTLTSPEDCADCLCRVCARNRCNDSWSHLIVNDFYSCRCDCDFGDEIIETEDDCNLFLPDELE